MEPVVVQQPTLMVFTRLAVLLATSLADWTKCLLATGLAVLDEAMRQALQRAEVCLATIVAADRTYKARGEVGGTPRFSAESLEASNSHVQNLGNNTCTSSAAPKDTPRKGGEGKKH